MAREPVLLLSSTSRSRCLLNCSSYCRQTSPIAGGGRGVADELEMAESTKQGCPVTCVWMPGRDVLTVLDGLPQVSQVDPVRSVSQPVGLGHQDMS